MPNGSSSSEQDSGGYPLPAFHFQIAFAGRDTGGDTSFQEVSGIGAELDVEPVAEGGENRFVHQLPKAVKHPKLVLKRGIAKSDSALVKWCKAVLEQDYVKAIETKELDVRLLNQEHQPVCSWSFGNAYPVNWDVEGFNSTKNEVAIEKIELVYSFETDQMTVMPIEVKQLVVRGDIQSATEPNAPEEHPAVDLEEMKAEILESCRRMMEELLRESRER